MPRKKHGGSGRGRERDAPRVYLDHNATSPLRAVARAAFDAALDADCGNPASLHAEGRAARARIETARERVARLAGCPASEVVFTSGGSESLAAAVRGVCDRAPANRRRIVVSAVEHSAVLEAARLAARRGFVVVNVPCGREGRVEVERYVMNLDSDIALAALQWANNETGVVQPVEEIGRACRDAAVPFLVDAVQAAGKIELDPKRVRADLLALSGHKLGGAQGTGALVVREGVALAPLVGGGAQEKRRRGGTPSVAALAAFGAAAEEAELGLRDEATRLLRLRAHVETVLREQFPDVRFHGQAAPRLPNTVNFALPGVPGETLAIALDLAGFAVSTGSACSSGVVEPSHVIRAMGYDDREARSAVRVSLGWSTTAGEVDRFLVALPDVVRQVREGLAESA
jgi:cysteine desulfurase